MGRAARIGLIVVCDDCLHSLREHLGATGRPHDKLDDETQAWIWDAVSDIRRGGTAGQWAEAILRAWLWTPERRAVTA